VRLARALFVGTALCACRAPVESVPAPAPARLGEEIVVCGERVAIGTPVVLWFESPFYSGYATEPVLNATGPIGLRYQPGRTASDPDLEQRVAHAGWNRDTLGEQVDLFVVHYDVCGTSRTCFDVLHDRRQLSVHFLLDVDGTIYQTLDLQEQAWHARQANPRSIGIEIAQIGCYPVDEPTPLEEWYGIGEDGTIVLTIPERFGDGGVRTPDFQGRPARPDLVVGRVQGQAYVQYDFTPEQYAALAKLTAALTAIFPRLRPDFPRDTNGKVRTDALTDEEFAAFAGILGHYHVSTNKRDPGPAFDWGKLLRAVRAGDGP